jgi:hypothetical protein
MNIFIYFLMFFLSQNIIATGFSAETLVLTPNGHVAIEFLKPGDQVLCSDLQESIVVGNVKDVSIKRTNFIVNVQTDDGETIKTISNQKFYNANLSDWIETQKLVRGTVLMGFESNATVLSVVQAEEFCDYFAIAIEPYTNFFITKKNILVHNFGLSAMVPTIIRSAGVVIPATIGVVEKYLSGKKSKEEPFPGLFRSKKDKLKKEKRQQQQERTVSGCGFPPPEDPDKDKYENNPKHHKNVRGNISTPPKFGQKALDNSLYVKTNDNGLQVKIGIEDGKIIAFHEHTKGHFHGYVRPWKELTRDMKEALSIARWINHRGKILI